MFVRSLIVSSVLFGCAAGGVATDDPEDTLPAQDGGKKTPPPASTSDAAQTPPEDPPPDEPTQIGNYAPGDIPDFKTAAELCAYVNTQRGLYSSHDRFRGAPWSGAYHTTTTWPLTLTVDATLSASALALAKSLAGGAAPTGGAYSDGSPPPHKYLYVSGTDTASYTIASQEKPGDWKPDMVGNIHAGITYTNGTSRMALFYHDSGGQGPALNRIGCGGAQSPGGTSWWWVIQMAP